MPSYQEAATAFQKEGEDGLKRYIGKNGNNPNAIVDFTTSESYLHVAAKMGNLELAKALLHLGADKNLQALRIEIVHSDLETDSDQSGANKKEQVGSGMTALHLAAEQGHFLIVELLVTQGANCNCQDVEGMTPLMKALDSLMLAGNNIKSQLEQIVDYFTQNNALDLGKVDKQENNILHYAASISNTVVLEKMLGKLKQHTLSTKSNFSSFLNAKNRGGSTPLVRAIDGLLVENIQCLLNVGAHPYAGLNDTAAIWFRIIAGNVGENANNLDKKSQVLKLFLIALGCPPNFIEGITESLLNLSANKIDNTIKREIVSLLKRKNAKAQALPITAHLLLLNVMPCLAIAASEVLLSAASASESDPDLESRLNKLLSESNNIILEFATLKRDSKRELVFVLTIYLVQMKIGTKKLAENVATLTDMVLKGQGYAFNQHLTLLRKNNASEVIESGNFLFEMVQSPATEATIELLDAFDADYRDERGRTLLHCAAAAGNLPHVKKLSTKSRDLNIGDHHRNTPLHLAAQAGHVSVYYYLRGKGADTRKHNNQTLTPFQQLSLADKLLLGMRSYAVELLILLGLVVILGAVALLLFTSFAPATILGFSLSLGVTKLELFGVAVGALCMLALIAEGVSLLINHFISSKTKGLPSQTSASPSHSPSLRRDLKLEDKRQETLGCYSFDLLGWLCPKSKIAKNTSPTNSPVQLPGNRK